MTELPPNEPTTWLLLAVGEDRQHGGNDGYIDEPDAFYSWDSTVPNHGAVGVGDRVILWDKKASLGTSVIEDIAHGIEEKLLHRCRACNLAGIKPRKTMTPRYKCYKCQEAFEAPITRVETVTTYRSRHDANWIALDGVVDGARLRRACTAPESQLSIRRIRWTSFMALLSAEQQTAVKASDALAREASIDGHRVSRVRVRVGQAKFRRKLLETYGSACAVTGPAPTEALEAGHLYSYAQTGVHHEHGGLLLRRDVHRLFDSGLIGVDEAGSVRVARTLRDFPTYSSLDGSPIQVALTSGHRRWLAQHWTQHFTSAQGHRIQS